MKKFLFLFVTLVTFSSTAFAEHYKKMEFEEHKIFKYEFDLTDHKLELVRALDDGKLAVENVLSCSRRHNAEAAFNGGFYHEGHAKTGVPTWLMINKSNNFAVKSVQDAMYIENDEIKFNKLKTRIFLIDANNKKIEIHSINNPVPSGIRLFTQNYWKKTLTDPGTFEVVVDKGVIISMNKNGNNDIPENGFVLSSNNSSELGRLSHLKIGQKLSYELMIKVAGKPLILAEIPLIISGSDLLIKNFRIPNNITSKRNKSTFRDEPHGRTAICQFNKTKYAVYIADHNPAKSVYDISFRDMIMPLKREGLNRETALKMPLGELLQLYAKLDASSERSIGISLGDFARFLEREGCMNAINLDGGGSSTLVVGNKVVNTPTGLQNVNVEGKNLRAVGDILLIKKKKHPIR